MHHWTHHSNFQYNLLRNHRVLEKIQVCHVFVKFVVSSINHQRVSTRGSLKINCAPFLLFSPKYPINRPEKLSHDTTTAAKIAFLLLPYYCFLQICLYEFLRPSSTTVIWCMSSWGNNALGRSWSKCHYAELIVAQELLTYNWSRDNVFSSVTNKCLKNTIIR